MGKWAQDKPKLNPCGCKSTFGKIPANNTGKMKIFYIIGGWGTFVIWKQSWVKSEEVCDCPPSVWNRVTLSSSDFELSKNPKHSSWTNKYLSWNSGCNGPRRREMYFVRCLFSISFLCSFCSFLATNIVFFCPFVFFGFLADCSSAYSLHLSPSVRNLPSILRSEHFLNDFGWTKWLGKYWG